MRTVSFTRFPASAAATALCAALFAAGTVGCVPSKAFLSADVQSIELSATDVAARTVAVNASSPWLVEVVPDVPSAPVEWLSAGYDAASDALLWIKATERNESLIPRSATVSVLSADALTLRIPVTQSAMDISLAVTPQVPEPFGPRDGTVRTLSVATDLTSWEFFALDGSWLTVERVEETNDLTLTAADTRLMYERRDTVVVRPVSQAYWEYTDSIPVVQRGIDLVVDCEAMDDATHEIALPAEGGETTVSVYSRAGWTLTTDADPGRVSFDILEGGADTENGVPVVITATENGSGEEYTFTITFASGDQTYTYTCRQPAVQ